MAGMAETSSYIGKVTDLSDNSEYDIDISDLVYGSDQEFSPDYLESGANIRPGDTGAGAVVRSQQNSKDEINKQIGATVSEW